LEMTQTGLQGTPLKMEMTQTGLQGNSSIFRNEQHRSARHSYHFGNGPNKSF